MCSAGKMRGKEWVVPWPTCDVCPDSCCYECPVGLGGLRTVIAASSNSLAGTSSSQLHERAAATSQGTMAQNPVKPIESSSPDEVQPAALNKLQHTAEALLDKGPQAGRHGGRGARPGGSPGEPLAENLLQELGGATLDDIVNRGLSSTKSAAAAAKPARKALDKGDKHLKARNQVAQKKMGMTIQPLQSQKMMYKGASGSESASAFLARREGRVKRRKQ